MLIKFLFWNGEAKVSNLVGGTLVENIGRFNISVKVSGVMYIDVPRNDLLQNLNCLRIRYCFSLFERGGEVSFTKFSDYVSVIFGRIDII